MLDDLNEAEQIKETIKCFKRACATQNFKLSEESRQFVLSKEFKQLINAQTRSSVLLHEILVPSQKKPIESSVVVPEVEEAKLPEEKNEGKKSQETEKPEESPKDAESENGGSGLFKVAIGLGLVAAGAFAYFKYKKND